MKHAYSRFRQQFCWSVLLLLFLSTTSTHLFAQLEQRYWIWGYGNTPGNIEFFPGASSPWTGNTPPSPLASFGFEGTGVATDPATGTLLFYTDGNSVYDAAHSLQISNLGGDPSSGQPVALCVVPNCPFDTFYIFSNSTGTSSAGTNQGPITYRTYNAISQTFSSVQNLPSPYNSTLMAEGMIVVPNPNNPLEFWLLTQELSSNRYPVFRIDGSGIALQAVYTFGPAYTTPQGIGNMAFTPVSYNNSSVGEVAFIHSGGGKAAYSCQFDATTGAFITSSYNLASNFSSQTGIPYDVEWSPNGRFLYFSTYFRTNIYQYDMATSSILTVTTGQNTRGGGIKLAPDGSIYHVRNAGPAVNTPGNSTIAAITTPDLLQSAGGFTYNASAFTFTNLFGYNWPEFITRPNWSATVNVQGGDSICPGETVLLTTTVNVTGASVTSYQWFLNGNAISGATSSSYTVSTPGTYHVVVQLSIGCEIASIPVSIFASENCCFAADDPQYTHINTDVTYTSYTAWAGKIYVAPGVTVSVDNATLDITNVDVVFGACAAIDFVNSAEIRANNSVFRPCNPLDSWRGINLRNGVTGTVNECTFKNAWNALNFLPSSQPSAANLTNNLFSNTRTAITSNSNTFDAAITGNSFFVDASAVDFQEQVCNYSGSYANDHYGIRGLSSDFLGNISQNDFVNGSEPDNSKQFFGVHIASGQGHVSHNTFTNMWRSVDLLGAFATDIENNRCEVNRHFENRESQIRIAESNSVTVTGNRLVQAAEAMEFQASRSGIYAESSSALYIHKNSVDGFSIGIAAFSVASTSIGENEIYDGGVYGIYGQDCAELDIVCNQIHMAIDEPGNHIGIGYLQFDIEETSVGIRNNCVFDSEWAMLLFSGNNAPMPQVTNNYMYNYTVNGIFNQGFVGAIGTSGGSFNQAARNTFASNNTPNGALDVNSTVPITVGGNFGIVAVSGTVNVTGNNAFHSTAACGHQLSESQEQQLTEAEDCDIFNFKAKRLLSDKGDVAPSEFLLARLAQASPDARLEIVKGALGTLSADLSTQELQRYLLALVSANALPDLSAQLQAAYFVARITRNAGQARAALAAFAPSDAAQGAWKRLQTWLLDLGSGQVAVADLSDADLAFLQVMQDASHRYAGVARDFLHLARGGYDYRFKSAHLPDAVTPDAVVNLTDDFLEIWPNPVADQVNVRFSVAQSEAMSLEVVDLLGRQLLRHATVADSQQLRLDMQTLKPGVYFIVLRKNGEHVVSQKVVKK